jgi:hypothetical protein
LVTANARARTAILALACLGHAVLIMLLSRGVDGTRYRVLAREPEPLRLVLLDSLTRPEATSARMPAPELVPPSDAITLPIPDIDAIGIALAPPVSDSMPSVDWIDERRREVATVAARERGGNSRALERGDDRCGSTRKPRQRCAQP